MIFAVPLAWFQLTYEKGRLLVAIAGIMFAVILIFMQIGFADALFRSAIRLHTNLRGDIVLISPESTNLVGMRNFPQRRLYQSLSAEGVDTIAPVYLTLGSWKIPPNTDPACDRLPAPPEPNGCEILSPGSTRNILVLGVDPDTNVFKLAGIDEVTMAAIKLQDVVLFDRASRREFGKIVYRYETLGETVNREVGGRKLTIGGLFELGSSFASDGSIITSDLNFLRIFDNRRAGLINIGIINLIPNSDRASVLKSLINLYPVDQITFTNDGKQKITKLKTEITAADLKAEDFVVGDIRVMTMDKFIAFERSYWQNSTSIGFIFTLGSVMGFIVGVVIVYQILYTDVSDHMAEYATLKAMGYSNWYLAFIVIQEAFALSILGFIPGFVACIGLYALTKNATRLPLDMTFERGLQVLILTVLMCVISGAISLRKVQSADPAEIFG
jgi:putative ABC transport system permease protein